MPTIPSPDELRIGNYIQTGQPDIRFVRLLGIRPGLLQQPIEATNYLVDVLDPLTKKYGHGWFLGAVLPIPVTPELLLRLDFDEQPAGLFPSDLEQVYTWPSDEDSYWLVSFDGEGVFLWMVLDDEERCMAEVTSLHHLQNLLFDLDEVQLRFEFDKETIASAIATNSINGAPLL